MCLITKQKEPIVLEKDMVVYKLGGKVVVYKIGEVATTSTGSVEIMRTVHQAHAYILGKLNTTEIRCTERDRETASLYDNKALLHYQLHYHSDLFKNGYLLSHFISIGPGFHWATTVERILAGISGEEDIYKCIVPAGSQVYFDETHLGVSDKLIVKELIAKENLKRKFKRTI